MAKKSKAKSTWACSDCGVETQGWFGRCSACGAWNTIEERVALSDSDRVVLHRASSHQASAVVSADQARSSGDRTERMPTGIAEFDRVLGGGLVPGSLVLIGGAPGIGKSTLLLQACAGLAELHGEVLYVSGEESVAQVGLRAHRVGSARPDVSLLAETRIEEALEIARSRSPRVLIVDSIQTVYSEVQDGLPGNLTQIRSVTAKLMTFAKTTATPIVIVGHVTKDGQLAGPRMLEHMVDAVIAFEGDEERSTRMLRATKNRYGNTQELGVFEMTGEGLAQVENPSEAFLADQPTAAPGSCVTATMEGTRPLLVEIQALLSQSAGGSARRTCVGADPQRLAMLLAVLDRHAGVFVADQDVFVNVAGGLRLSEPASDLATFLAVCSSHRRQSLGQGTLAFGEIGLTGELRRVPRLEDRLREAARLGFKRAIVPRRSPKGSRDRAEMPTIAGLQIDEVADVNEAIETAFDCG